MKNKRYLLVLSAVSLIGVSLVSCNSTEIDYTTNGDCKLTLDYEGKSFFKDGIEQVDVYQYIDGDTTHFKSLSDSSSAIIKSRYYGIDTPESTGKIEEYGEEAKQFTKQKLKNASENGTIVVSSPFFTYKAPETDSTGSRYLSLVWINETTKNAPKEDLILLNLYIVQEGLSYVKALDKVPEFKETFLAAEEQAKKFKKNLFSGQPAPLFNYGDYEEASLLEIKNELVKSLTDETYENPYAGAKVRVRGTVSGFANGMLYLQSYFDEDSGSTKTGGEYAGINIYTGTSSISSKYTRVNSFIEVSGTLSDSEEFGFQMSGVNFQKRDYDEEKDVGSDKSRVIYSPEDIPDEYKAHTFSVKASELTAGSYDYLFSPVSISDELTCSGGYDALSESGSVTSRTLYFEDSEGNSTPWNLYVPNVYYPDKENYPTTTWSSKDSFENKKFNVTGMYTFELQHPLKRLNIN